jgi:hypothetical protein
MWATLGRFTHGNWTYREVFEMIFEIYGPIACHQKLRKFSKQTMVFLEDVAHPG